jgi:hypothetical protein
MALAFDRGRAFRLLVVPALFDEHNRLRRLTVEVMRRLDGAGIDAFLPDLPGSNESLQALASQTIASWQAAIAATARHFAPTHVLGVRGGALLVPDGLPGWLYAPVKGATILRQLLRVRILAAREAGRSETQDGLMAEALEHGVELAGFHLGAELVRGLQAQVPPQRSELSEIVQAMVGGAGLWLRAEPDEDRAQADALAAILAVGIKA